ncbi:MAG: hypothetical protein M4579_002053 [Chaenotheca gracillima]|nr:MAG: hypothetical protein M4579_002053 [Chaenotheca gracillima]
MATTFHGIYCFEVLASSLEHRDTLSLHQVEELWEQYSELQAQTSDDTHDDEEYEDEEGDEEVRDSTKEVETRPQNRPLANTSTRLLVPSPASGSSSSTPSTVSLSSNRTPVSSSSSSRSSFFSLGRQPRRQEPSRADSRPLFVTWNTLSKTGRKSLRGCIGTFEAQELGQGLKSYALTSAFDDTRFLPIAKRELSSLEVGVTLLTDFESASTPTSWDLGTHGLRISFTYHSKRYGATYLPDVPVEQGWTKEETLISLMRKAGWTGKEHDWQKVNDLRVIRYQGKAVHVGYQEYVSWRQWVDSRDAA